MIAIPGVTKPRKLIKSHLNAGRRKRYLSLRPVRKTVCANPLGACMGLRALVRSHAWDDRSLQSWALALSEQKRFCEIGVHVVLKVEFVVECEGLKYATDETTQKVVNSGIEVGR